MPRRLLLSLAILTAILMVPAVATAADTHFDIKVVNNTDYYVGYIMHGPTNADGDLAPHDTMTIKTSQTAYLATESTSDYNMMFICAWNQVVSMDFKIVNMYTVGPNILEGKCSFKVKNNNVSCWELNGAVQKIEHGSMGTIKKMVYLITLTERQ